MTRAIIAAFLLAANIGAYSVLTHEAIIDSAWDRSIQPLLRKRFPNLNEKALRDAHAHAYGGAIMPDIGYYPLGSRMFSDLVHYVRAGDFVAALIDEAHDANELAFALGALAHLSADSSGHEVAINRIVPMLYTKLRKRYGDVISYEQAPSAHMKTEFAFDVVQVAHERYAPEAYRDFIGFRVAKPVLERAFLKTYGMELNNTFFSVDLALGTFRYAVADVIPEMTKTAWSAKKDEIVKAAPGATRETFIYNLSRASFEKEWGTEYERSGWFARFLAVLFKIVPKLGPFEAFAFRAPGPEAQKLFMQSFNRTLEEYRMRLAMLNRGQRLELPNQNLDTGKASHFGAYRLADKTFAKLLKRLNNRKYNGVDAALRATVLAYYKGAKPLDPKIAAQLANLKEAALLPSANATGSSRSSSPELP